MEIILLSCRYRYSSDFFDKDSRAEVHEGNYIVENEYHIRTKFPACASALDLVKVKNPMNAGTYMTELW